MADLPAPEAPGRVLIVDDEPSILEIGMRVVSELGFQVDVASDGTAAFNRVLQEQGRYDIVITDSKMPGLDGPELAHRLKRLYPKIDVIVMTGYPELEVAVEILKQGAYDYLVKPLDIDVLSACVNRCWEKRKIERALSRERSLRGSTREIARQIESEAAGLAQESLPESARARLKRLEDLVQRLINDGAA